MSASCIAYCFDTFTSHCQGLEYAELKEFLREDLGYAPFLPRELYQEHKWLLDEGALSEWLTEYLNDRLSDHDAVNALVEGAFECPTADSRKALVNQCLKWLNEYQPTFAMREQINKDLLKARIDAYDYKTDKTVVQTNTTADSSTLLSLKTELADAKKQLMMRDYEYAELKTKFLNLKKEIFRLSAEWKGMSKAFEIRFPE
jgi:hypothetical protein